MKPDYKKILDPEIWKFIQDTESFYSETEEKDMSIAEVRSAYNEMCKFFSITKPAEVKSEDKFIQSIPIRVYHKTSNINKMNLNLKNLSSELGIFLIENEN